MYFVIFLKCFWRTAQFVDYGLSSVFSHGSGWVRSETELFMTQFFVELSRMHCVTSSTQNVTLSWSRTTNHETMLSRTCRKLCTRGLSRYRVVIHVWLSRDSVIFPCRVPRQKLDFSRWISCVYLLPLSLSVAVIAVARFPAEWGREALPCILSNDVTAREVA